jgi:hypothetical protein
VHLVRRPLVGSLHLPWMMNEYKAVGGMKLAGETEVLGEDMP